MNRKILKALLIAGPFVPIHTASRPLIGSIRVSETEIIMQARRAALRHNLDADLYLAILRVESGLKPAAYNAQSQDIGLAQINKHTARVYGLNAYRLKHDYKYNLSMGAIILADFKARYESRNPKLWPCRYNLGSKPLIGPRLRACLKYLDKINKAK